ncbi:helix-turn-helix domain-containing protein [Streptomyces albus]|uniref:XRE family transcriptional regulator n=1 Tax=Streptomyces albus TaxID=1888 RepID=A0A8H1QS43_9ACTN|nr:helix-turn-helix transcriptional regulator [Streptomyces albus]TGG84732.1 XRE family transcriptional regulator [Streptomyces albus]UVN56205.1 helix-turn-helix transcriptional regulator [Streptomyces albus]
MNRETDGTGSAVDAQDPRKQFAEECRSARELYPGGPLTQTELARMVRTSKSTISRVENCVGPIPAGLPSLLDQVFATDGLFKRLYEEVESRGFPAHSRPRIELEPRAVAIAEWSPTVVPGLLQTPDYARALFREGDPRASDAELASTVHKRMARQEILKGTTPPDFSAILCESVIRRRVGTPKVMREQLAVLLEHGKRPTSVIQVLPLDAGTHGLMDGPLSIVTTADGPPVVYTEGIRSGAIIDEPSQVRHLSRSYDVLTASALSRDTSAQMIRKHMEAL